jgi:hypothetical protein
MERRLVPGIEVEHAGKRWRVHQPLGPDAVLLCDEAGAIVSADPARIGFPADEVIGPPARGKANELLYSNEQWTEAARRRDLLARLAILATRSRADVDAVAHEIGIKRRRVWMLLREAETNGYDIASFLPKYGAPRAARLDAGVEAIVAQAIEQHTTPNPTARVLRACIGMSRDAAGPRRFLLRPIPRCRRVCGRAIRCGWRDGVRARRPLPRDACSSVRILAQAHRGSGFRSTARRATSCWCARTTGRSSDDPR